MLEKKSKDIFSYAVFASLTVRCYCSVKPFKNYEQNEYKQWRALSGKN